MTKKIRVHVNGATGRMGSMAVSTISASGDCEVVGTSRRGDDFHKLVREISPDVVVDFTVAEVAFQNARTILELGIRPVIGTSGLKGEEVVTLQELASRKEIGGIIAPNFAIGAVLLMRFAQQAARYLPHCEVIELHHDRKQDAPSGTAIKTAALIRDARAGVAHVQSLKGTELFDGARGADVDGVPVHSIRLPGLVAHQEVLFGGNGELLTIRHDSLNRESFMSGVLLACREAMKLNSLVYGLEHVL